MSDLLAQLGLSDSAQRTEQVWSGRDRLTPAVGTMQVIIDGCLDVFLEPPGPITQRHYLFTREAGTVLPGMPETPKGARLVAVPAQPTRTVSIDWSSVLAAADTAGRAALCRALDEACAAFAGPAEPCQPDSEQIAARLAAIIESVTARAVEAEQARSDAIERTEQNRSRGFRDAIGALSQGLRGRLAGDAADAARGDLAAVLAHVVKAQGGVLDLKPEAETRALSSHDPLSAMTARAGLQKRAVHLQTGWWNNDHGPLIGFDKANNPLALIPDGHQHYRMWTPQAGDQVVTAAQAADIARQAFYVFMPLPEGKTGPADLLRFSLTGCAQDFRRIGLMLLLAGILSLATPVVTGWIMDPVIPEAQLHQLTVLIAALITLAVAMATFGLVRAFSSLRMEGAMDYRVQAAVWDRLLKLEAAFFREYAVGDLANRAMSINSIRKLLTGSLIGSLSHAVIGLFSFGLMVWYDWQLSAGALLFALIYMAIAYGIGQQVIKIYRQTLALQGQLQGLVLQLLGGLSRLRVAGAERSAFAQWGRPYGTLMGLNFQHVNLQNWLSVLKAGFHPLALGAVLAVIGLQSGALLAVFESPDVGRAAAGQLQQVMPTSHFVAFHVAFGQFIAAVFGLTSVAIQLTNLPPLYERVRPILEAPTEQAPDQADPGPIQGAIDLHDVVFGYSEQSPPVLKGLSLRADPGEFVAIVGPSGAGKSTLIRLLLGFEQPWSGSVFVDDKDLATLDRRAVRYQFGVVLQQGRLLSGSIFHNIAAGSDVDEDAAWEAARMAGFDADIKAMPMGLHTFLSEGATTLSGGQRQRLMIARALVRRPRVVIFDEATSALDNRTQAIVSESVASLACTRIVIAHRLSTIRAADRIYVLQDGRVGEVGDFATLMDQQGLFAALANRQLA